MISQSPIVNLKKTCYHCGDDCQTDSVISDEKSFCCSGCKTVYEILNQNALCNYYDIEKNPGVTQKIKIREGKFAFLDDITVEQQLVHFSLNEQQHVILYLPQMHCSSCVWLLEQLHKLNKGVIKSQVNFLKKEITVVFNKNEISLRKLADLLSSIGYEPHISLNSISTSKVKKHNRSKIFKIGIAGFCFGNIMMLSFPEYFSLGEIENGNLKLFFSYLNLLLALPVFFYCAFDFFESTYKSIRQKFLNIDAPIALAIVITFFRSVYEITTNTGAGYLDSMSGIVFFMLIGRYFQNFTYDILSFERDYTSYFPLGVSIITSEGKEEQKPVSKLKVGDRIKVHHGEIIPADCILFLGKASIDYSFVTGESLPTEKTIGEILYAGGKQTLGAIELEVIKDVSQSYLTQLWNNSIFKENKQLKRPSFIHNLSKYFTYVLFSIAIVTAIYWWKHNPENILNAVTSILIVACPCALLLSATFTNGNILRYLSRYGFYAKNADAVEQLAASDTLVFDKTGTITYQQESKLIYEGIKLSDYEKSLTRSLASQSNHPLSRSIVSFLPISKNRFIKNFQEYNGNGISASIEGIDVVIGSASFVNHISTSVNNGSRVYVKINGDLKGCFLIKNKYRDKLEYVIQQLKRKFKINVLSGDNDSEHDRLQQLFGSDIDMLFNQKPEEKLNYIKQLQLKGHRVVMLGDGLNDAGALRQSDVGIAISDDTNNFSPACDIIMTGNSFNKLPQLLNYCKKNKVIIITSFIISIIYNIVGLYFAVQGHLEPVIAAILMPISSVSIVLFTSISSWYFSLQLKDTKTDKDQVLK